MSTKYVVLAKGHEEEEWSDPIVFETRKRRDAAAEVYEQIGGLETDSLDIHRETLVTTGEPHGETYVADDKKKLAAVFEGFKTRGFSTSELLKALRRVS